MRVHHLNAGTLRPLGGRLIDGEPGLLRRATMVCHCLLLETDAGLVLVETGIGAQAAHRPDEWLGRRFLRLTNPDLDADRSAVRQIARLGFDPNDVRHVVLTHLDLDHAGGLADFPQATVHVYAEELRAAQRPRSLREHKRYRAAHFAHGPKWASYEGLGEPWRGFDAVRELKGLPPEILLIPLAGHTRGHAGVAVDTGDGWLLHAGDAYFHPGELDPDRPHCPPALALFESLVQTEKHARLHNQQRLRELARHQGDQVRILSAHNAAEYRQYATGRAQARRPVRA
ncbi:MBL fold metallo-hydrolase [Streptomyces sp. NRRL F-4489]|uniref:MBL fold metallo-hydrolase n=1 Tax=Streptomyces sp. NRRL F-4489 TaxID=1609095 RepID=UPI00074832F9|nr:MBL fold metallo-hydrolase [Streptomyces sp. NRRL F-4489]KUL45967.1 MBL fold metallo-hydrolase [Streptomyces sp. NRRL F-4489]